MTDYTSWHTGMEVIAINPTTPGCIEAEPIQGQTYTLSEIFTHRNIVIVCLAELPAPEDDICCRGWRASGFRPVEKRKTDISELKKLLKPVKEIA
ncbi:MAG TPA: hypothetical protein VFG14_14625 [Chthoniobacteraceae bacterium]|nr:hypothetical protein [Chthoniobacteraceae bacterium]